MKNNLDEDSLKRLNLIIEKTKAYDDCVFPVGSTGEFGALYISDLKKALSELETYKNKISEIKKWCDAIVNSEYDSRFYIDGKEIWTDTSACLDLANPILEIINKKEVEKGE